MNTIIGRTLYVRPFFDLFANYEVHASRINLLDSLIRNSDSKIFLPWKPPLVNGTIWLGMQKQTNAGTIILLWFELLILCPCECYSR